MTPAERTSIIEFTSRGFVSDQIWDPISERAAQVASANAAYPSVILRDYASVQVQLCLKRMNLGPRRAMP